MKKIFLILAAAVALSSCANAKEVGKEDFEKIVKEIVKCEGKILKETEKDACVKKGGCCYIHSDGKTTLVDAGGKIPHLYHRTSNPRPQNGKNDLIIVFYARPDKSGREFFKHIKTVLLAGSALDFDFGKEDFDEVYASVKSAPEEMEVTYQTTEEIAGKTHEIIFVCTDENSHEEEDYYFEGIF